MFHNGSPNFYDGLLYYQKMGRFTQIIVRICFWLIYWNSNYTLFKEKMDQKNYNLTHRLMNFQAELFLGKSIYNINNFEVLKANQINSSN